MTLPQKLTRSLVSATAVLLLSGVGTADVVYPSPEAAKPLAAGATVPSADVRTVLGEAVELRDVVRDHGALLVFYRGGW